MTKYYYIVGAVSRVSLAEAALKGTLDILVTVLGTGQYSVQGLAFCPGRRPGSKLLSPEDDPTVLTRGALHPLMSLHADCYSNRAKWDVRMLKLLFIGGFRWTESPRATLSPGRLWRALSNLPGVSSADFSVY